MKELDVKNIVKNIKSRNVTVITVDGMAFTGVLDGFISSVDNEPDEASITLTGKPHGVELFGLFCKCWGLANQQVFLAPNTIVFGVVLFAQQ